VLHVGHGRTQRGGGKPERAGVGAQVVEQFGRAVQDFGEGTAHGAGSRIAVRGVVRV
jgi:hypothetical protein